jgi:hypothetical protein
MSVTALAPYRAALLALGAVLFLLRARGHDIKLLFEPRDLWIGFYWDLEKEVTTVFSGDECYRTRRLLVYITLLPCLPLRLTFERSRWQMAPAATQDWV